MCLTPAWFVLQQWGLSGRFFKAGSLCCYLPFPTIFISFLYPWQHLFLLFPQHTGGAREQERKPGRMGTSCFSFPLRGGRGRGRERHRVLGHFRPLEAPLWGTKAREREDEEKGKGGEVESGKNRSAGCYSLRVTLPPPSAFPPVGLSKLNTHFPEKWERLRKTQREGVDKG